MNKLYKKQVVEVLDEALKKAQIPKRPSNGWIKEIRSALGMPVRILGARLGVDPSAITKMEKAEVARIISVKNIERVADALECDVHYVLVPRKPLQQILLDQAMKSAKSTILKVDHSMTIEKQKVGPKQIEKQIKDLADHLLLMGDRSIWDDV